MFAAFPPLPTSYRPPIRRTANRRVPVISKRMALVINLLTVRGDSFANNDRLGEGDALLIFRYQNRRGELDAFVISSYREPPKSR